MSKSNRNITSTLVTASRPTLKARMALYKNTPFKVILKKIIRRGFGRLNEIFYLPVLRTEFDQLKFSSHAMQKLIDSYNFSSILDIGCGEGQHTDIFIKNGKSVTGIDYGNSPYFKNNKSQLDVIVADFNEYKFDKEFDAIWCSHILEHQLNPNFFLSKVFDLLSDNGVLAITVPPSRSTIVGGHVTNWNAGLLLYNLVLAGFNCTNASVLKYDYKISVIVRKGGGSVDLKRLGFDAGDIRIIKPFLPNLKYYTTEFDDPFNGDLKILNW